jgi:hypothetical protein
MNNLLLMRMLICLSIIIIPLVLFLEFDLGIAITKALEERDWVANEDPLLDFKLLHASYFPNRYTALAHFFLV